VRTKDRTGDLHGESAGASKDIRDYCTGYSDRDRAERGSANTPLCDAPSVANRLSSDEPHLHEIVWPDGSPPARTS
jgi:hypothetical protein